MSQTILVIDDFAGVRLYHMSYLGRKGYHCVGARDGTEALAVLRETSVDLILLDLAMPGMDGEAFIQQLESIPSLRSLPVLVITSDELAAEAVLGRGAHAIGVLCKPVVPVELLRRVQQLLPKKIDSL